MSALLELAHAAGTVATDAAPAQTATGASLRRPLRALKTEEDEVVAHRAAAAEELLEQQKRRKISHSAIERRRRQRINEKIAQLQALVPECTGRDGQQMAFVLQKTIEYIKKLHVEVDVMRRQHKVLFSGAAPSPPPPPAQQAQHAPALAASHLQLLNMRPALHLQPAGTYGYSTTSSAPSPASSSSSSSSSSSGWSAATAPLSTSQSTLYRLHHQLPLAPLLPSLDGPGVPLGPALLDLPRPALTIDALVHRT